MKYLAKDDTIIINERTVQLPNHIFQDGNKRTGLEAAIFFLKENQYYLANELRQIKTEEKVIPEIGGDTDDILYNFTIEVASGKLTLEECQAWFKENIQQI